MTIDQLRSLMSKKSSSKSFMTCSFAKHYLLALSAFALILNFDLSAAETNSVSSFKQILERRPIVEKLLFDKELFSETVPKAARTQTYFARWQPEAYYVEVITKPSDIDAVSKLLMYGGQIDSRLWEIHAGALTILDRDKNTNSINSNPVYGNDLVLRKTIDLVLNLGITELQAGTLTWSGDRFQAQTENGQNIVGDLKYKDGNPAELSLSIPPRNGSFALIKYNYDRTETEQSFPSEILRLSGPSSGAPKEVFRIHVKEIKTSLRSMPLATFEPTNFVDSTRAPYFTYINNKLFSTEPLSREHPEPVMTLEEAHASMRKPTHFNVIMLVAMATLSALVLFAIVLISTKQKRKGNKV